MTRKVETKDSFERLIDSERTEVMELVADFHYRDCTKHDDGGMGTISITPAELTDCFAFMLMKCEGDVYGQ